MPRYLTFLTPLALAAASAARPVQYPVRDEDELRSLPAAGGRRSLHRPDGIVPGTERGERYLFWPMGVPEPGAMRQWGGTPRLSSAGAISTIPA